MSIEKIKKAVIREDLLSITENYKEAIILNQFIYWSERVNDADKFIEAENKIARENGEQEREPIYGWIYKTAEELSDEIMLGLSASQTRKYIAKLVDYGYIQKRNNPKYKWDRTLQYKVNLVNIARALKRKGYSLCDYKIEIPADNAGSNAHQCVINEAYNKNRNVSDNETIPETTITDTINNKDYNSETTTINAFTSREEVKGDIYAFERKSTPQKQEKSALKVPYIDAQNFTWGELHEHIHVRVTKMFQKHGVDDPEKLEELCKIIEYFYRKYDCGWKRYTILSDKALEGIVVKYLYPSYLLEENDVYSFESYKKMIDKYFNTDFGKNDKNGYGTKVPVELSLPHFMDDAIRESMAMNSLDMTDCIKSVHVDYYE